MRIENLSLDSHLSIMSCLNFFWGNSSNMLKDLHHPLFPLFFQEASFVLREKEIPAAYLYGIFVSEKGFVHSLATHSDYRRKGYASLLLNHWEESLQKKGIKFFYAYMLKENILSQKFFVSRQYKFLETIEVYPQNFRDMYHKPAKDYMNAV